MGVTIKLRGRPVPKGRPRAGIAGGWQTWRPSRLLPSLKSLLFDLSVLAQTNASAERFKETIMRRADALRALDRMPDEYPKTYIYTPGKTRDFEQYVALQARQAMGGKLSDELAVDILMTFNKRNFGDLDNYAKSVLDGLQGSGIFQNDRQIADLRSRRILRTDLPEQTIIKLREIREDQELF